MSQYFDFFCRCLFSSFVCRAILSMRLCASSWFYKCSCCLFSLFSISIICPSLSSSLPVDTLSFNIILNISNSSSGSCSKLGRLSLYVENESSVYLDLLASVDALCFAGVSSGFVDSGYVVWDDRGPSWSFSRRLDVLFSQRALFTILTGSPKCHVNLRVRW